MFLFSKCKDMGNTAQSFPFLSIFIINLRNVPFYLDASEKRKLRADNITSIATTG